MTTLPQLSLDITERVGVKRCALLRLERATTRDGQRVLLKSAAPSAGGSAELALARELAALGALTTPGVARPIGVLDASGEPCICYPDFPGVALGHAPLPAGAFVAVARQLVDIVDAFHAAGLLVLGLRPSSLLCDPGGELLLVDAPHAVWRSAARPLENAWSYDPFLPYLAPELLRRTGDDVDWAADHYALGALLYALFAGRAPFASSDPDELIQAHLAREPQALVDVCPELEPRAAEAVLGLLAKQPAARVAGHTQLRALLGPMAREERASSPSPEPRWSRRAYGRSRQLNELRELLSDAEGPRLVAVEGEPGSGKSELVSRLSRTSDAAVCFGKFERWAAAPLSAWLAVLRNLAAHALGMSAPEFARLSTRLRAELGVSAPVVVKLADEWRPVLGSDPCPPAGAEGELNRTAVAIQRLLFSFAEEVSPVWVLLDDLQWADPSSLRILELVLAFMPTELVRVVGSVRSPAAHEDRGGWDATRERLGHAGVPQHVIALAGWEPAEVQQFLCDSLGGEVRHAAALAALVHAKTQGNPLFTRELLATLVRQGVLREGNDGWQAPEGASLRLAVPDGLLELLAQRVHRLRPDLRALLYVVGSAGGRVRWRELSAMTGLADGELSARLRAAIGTGLLQEHAPEAPTSDEEPTYGIVHDRVSEALQRSISDAERGALCLRAYRALRDAAPTRDESVDLLLARLLGSASALLTDDGERVGAVQALLRASAHSKATGAYVQAHALAGEARAILLACAASAAALPELRRDVLVMFAETALGCGDNALSERTCRELLAEPLEALSRAATSDLLIRALNAQQRFAEAVETALVELAQLGVRFPKRPSMAHVIWGYVWARRKLLRVGAAAIESLPLRDDATSAAASQIMQSVYAVASFTQPELFPLMAFREFEMCQRLGNHRYAGESYNAFAMVLAGLGEHEHALALGEVGLSLTRRLMPAFACRSSFSHHSFVVPWVRPVREVQPVLFAVTREALAYGDFEYLGYAMTMRALGQLYWGEPLAELSREFAQNLAQLTALAQERCVLMQRIVCEAVHELRTGLGAPGTEPLNGPHYSAQDGLARAMAPLDHTLVYHHYLAQLMLAVLRDDPTTAWRVIGAAEPHLERGAFASYLVTPYLFFEAWTVARVHLLGLVSRGAAARRLRRIEKKLSAMVAPSGSNFRGKLLFVQAERLRLAGRPQAAALRYEAAAEAALREELSNEAGLILERAATLMIELGSDRLAAHLVRDAHRLYRQWGATSVAERLARAHPKHLPGADAGTPLEPYARSGLDYRTLLKASQALSGEPDVPRIVERLLRTSMEHTAAQRGVLVLEDRGELRLDAEVDVAGPVARLAGGETVDSTARLSPSIVRYAARLGRPVVVDEATEHGSFARDSYVTRARPRSVLCVPVFYRTKLLALVYLENNRLSHVFTEAQTEMVSLLAAQAAISIANARFHALQLEAQQARISPHFLFNALSSIAELAVIDGARAETALVKLAHLYRYILACSVSECVPIERELAIVRDYLALEKLRFGAKLEYTLTVDGELEGVRLPGLLIQPLVENAIRHGVARKLGAGHVHVLVRSDAGRCSVVVHDDGDGTVHESTGTGFGMRSVQQRLALVYGSDYGLAIERRDGYRVEVEFPSLPVGAPSEAPLAAAP